VVATLLLALPALSAACADADAGAEERQAATGSAAAAPPADGGYAVVHGWPALPAGFRMGESAGVAVTSRNEVVLFHRADQTWLPEEGMISRPTLTVFDGASGRVLRELGEGLFRNPHGVAVDGQDNIWVADNQLHQVFKLSPEGEVLLTVGEAGVPGADGAHFDGVTDVAVAADGSFYVSDGYGNDRVAHFAADGTFLRDWGGRGSAPGEFDLPHAITLDDEGRVYVADRTNSRVQVFDPEGTFLAEWTPWQARELGRPWGIEYHDGSVYVADGGEYWSSGQYRSERPDTLPVDFAQVQRLDLDGRILEAWGRYGRYDGEMIWPHDLAVDGDGNVYTGGIRGMRVQKWARGGGSVER
jgi:peptidylamidoglycolate lyase